MKPQKNCPSLFWSVMRTELLWLKRLYWKCHRTEKTWASVIISSASHGCPLIRLHSASIEVTKSVFKKTVKNVQCELTCFCHAFNMLSKFYLLACYTSHNWCTVKMFQVEINCLAHHTKPKTLTKSLYWKQI